MNVCTREEAQARANVKKFEPTHGWGSDKRPDDMLTTGELLSLVAWLRERNARLSSAALDNGRCRHNCRTKKEIYLAGWHDRDRNPAPKDGDDLEDYDEWKGKRATSAKDNKGGV